MLIALLLPLVKQPASIHFIIISNIKSNKSPKCIVVGAS